MSYKRGLRLIMATLLVVILAVFAFEKKYEQGSEAITEQFEFKIDSSNIIINSLLEDDPCNYTVGYYLDGIYILEDLDSFKSPLELVHGSHYIKDLSIFHNNKHILEMCEGIGFKVPSLINSIVLPEGLFTVIENVRVIEDQNLDSCLGVLNDAYKYQLILTDYIPDVTTVFRQVEDVGYPAIAADNGTNEQKVYTIISLNKNIDYMLSVLIPPESSVYIKLPEHGKYNIWSPLENCLLEVK